MEFIVLTAYKDGTLEEMIRVRANEHLARWPKWNEAAAIGMVAAYFAKLGAAENAALTHEARRESEAVDDLFWWLKEEAPASVLGYLSTFNRAILFDMEEYDAVMESLEAMNWSEHAREERLVAPTRKAIRDYHEDILKRIAAGS